MPGVQESYYNHLGSINICTKYGANSPSSLTAHGCTGNQWIIKILSGEVVNMQKLLCWWIGRATPVRIWYSLCKTAMTVGLSFIKFLSWKCGYRRTKGSIHLKHINISQTLVGCSSPYADLTEAALDVICRPKWELFKKWALGRVGMNTVLWSQQSNWEQQASDESSADGNFLWLYLLMPCYS